MSGGGGGFRASAIPSNVRKMIQNIKEITGNHSDDEIYAMLKDCSMDPNDTAQKLLLQDTFHEVKSRRDRRKENQHNRDTVDMRWKPGHPRRGGRGGRGNYTSRYAAQDGVVGKKSSAGKDNGINQASDKTDSISSPLTQDANTKDAGSSVTVMANGPIGVVSGGAKSVRNVEVLSRSGTMQADMSAQSQRQSLIGASKRSNVTSGGRDADPVLVPLDSRVPSAVGVLEREVGSRSVPVESISNVSVDPKSNNSKLVGKSQGVGKNQVAEFSQSHGGSSSSRPSSNYGTRLQQTVGSQKVGPNMEWKPKPINTNAVLRSKTMAAPDVSNVSAEASADTQPVQKIADSEECTEKLEHLQVRDAQQVIIPDHIHVPDAVRSCLSFGSFDSAFVTPLGRSSEQDNQKNSKPDSEINQEVEALVEERTTSEKALTPSEEADNVHGSQSSEHVPESLSSGDVGVPSGSVPDSSGSKETGGGSQQRSVDTSASYNFGLMPPVLGSPPAPVEASETRARDVSTAPNLVVQPPSDPSSFYTQLYRSGQDTDGRISPYPVPGVAAKYSGNVTVLSLQTSQSPELQAGNSMVLSTTAQTALATQAQAGGVMPSSVAVTQQPMPLFRQPPGVHIPHYPPNYLPYGHYFSPFYVPPAMHQFLGNNAFPQQAQAGSVYPGPPAPTTGVKFPISQYKPGSNPGNSAHMGVGASYGPYGASPVGYNTASAATPGNSTANDELAASQFKESNMYITGQQSEGSGVWIPGPGREISALPATSFYNLGPPPPPPGQGQHVTFGPNQGGQGTFAGIYHPAQAVTAATVHPLLQQSQAIDMVGPTASVYQQPQHAQLNWPNNY